MFTKITFGWQLACPKCPVYHLHGFHDDKFHFQESLLEVNRFYILIQMDECMA